MPNLLACLVASGTNLKITVSNAGPGAALDVMVTDVLPTGLELVGTDASVGSYDSTTGQWVIGTLEAGATERLTITVEVTGTGTITNTATVASSTLDPQPGNTVSSVAISVSSGSLPVTGFNPTRLAALAIGLTRPGLPRCDPDEPSGISLQETPPDLAGETTESGPRPRTEPPIPSPHPRPRQLEYCCWI